jgi:hypothetical protein
MKFKVTMKDPDTLGDAIDEAVREDIAKIPGLTGEDREALFENRREATAKIAAKWFRYSEYVTVEIDTEARTATVCDAQ